MATYDPLHPDDVVKLQEALDLIRAVKRRLDNFHVDGAQLFHNTPEGINLVIAPPKRPLPQRKVAQHVLAKITAAHTNGKYTGTAYTGTPTVTAGTGNLSLPEGLTAGTICTILNPEEDGQATSWINPDSFVECDYFGGTDSANPARPLLIVSGVPKYKYTSGGENQVGSSAEGSASASSDTWIRSATTAGSNYGNCSIGVHVVSRVVYDHSAGTPTLYAMMRRLAFDAGGRLVEVGVETAVAVDSPEDICD